jgi:hypothetical protein
MMAAPKISAAKTRAETFIRTLAEQGFSEAEIGRRGGIARATVWNVLNPEAHRGGVRESKAKSVVGRLKRDQRMFLVRDYGSVWIEPTNKRERSKLRAYWDAVDLARKGDWTALEEFRGKTVTVLDKGKRGKLKLLDDRDRKAFDRLKDLNLLAPDEITRYDRNRTPKSVAA